MIAPLNASDIHLAQSLAETVGATAIPIGHPVPGRWHLLVDSGAVSLIDPTGDALCLHFGQGRSATRLRESGRFRTPLARAIGASGSDQFAATPMTVVDATGGLGQDSWAIAALGCEVTLIERHPLLQGLLLNALQRAQADPSKEIRETAARLCLLQGNAGELLPGLALQADVVYLDPMYPEQRRRGASRKGMQMLHMLIGEDAGNEQLLATALGSANRRVVVKRSLKAPSIAGDADAGCQRTSLASPNTRFDIYHVNTPA